MAYNPFLRSRLSSGYGDYLNRTSQTGIFEGFIDNDGDGIDDRYQAGPGQPDMRNQFQTPPQGFVQRQGPATQALVHFYNPTTGQTWTAPNGSYVPPAGWGVLSQEEFENVNQQQNQQQNQQINQQINQRTNTQPITRSSTVTDQYPHGRMPDFEAYVNASPGLLRAYKKKYGDDMSMLQRWGRQHWRKQGKEAGREMQFQAAPKFDPSLFKGKKTSELENQFNPDNTAMRNQAKSWRQQHMDAAKKKHGFGTDDFNKSDFIKQRNKIASRHRRMVGAGDKTLKSGTVVKGYNP